MSETATGSAVPMRELIAEEIRALLARRKISASELARRMGATQPYISRRLTGDTALDVDDLDKIAAILGVDVVDLLPRRGEGRLITTTGSRTSFGVGTNDRSSRPARSTRPDGHLTHTGPDVDTRRPSRVRPRV